MISSLSDKAEEAGVVAVVVTGLGMTEGMLVVVMTMLEGVTRLEVVVARLVTTLGEAVWTTGVTP